MAEQGLSKGELAEKAGVEKLEITRARWDKQPLSVESERKVARVLGMGRRELSEGDGKQSEGAGSSSVRLVAGQSRTVEYPEIEEKSGEESSGGWRGDLVSVAGLRNRRAFKDLSQSELSRRSGVNRTTIKRLV